MYYSLFKQTKIYLNSWKYSKSPGNWIEGKIISFKKKIHIWLFKTLIDLSPSISVSKVESDCELTET